MPDLVLLDMLDLFNIVRVAGIILCAPEGLGTNVVMVPDSFNSNIVKGSIICSKSVNLVVLLDSHMLFSVRSTKALFVAPMNISCPCRMSINPGSINTLLEGNNVFAEDGPRSSRGIVYRRSQDGWEQSSKEQEGVLDELHAMFNPKLG